jgi:hypothetical protein
MVEPALVARADGRFLPLDLFSAIVFCGNAVMQ